MIPRHLLPQIPKDKYKEFIEFLQDHEIRVQVGKVLVSQLRPIQAHVNREKVESLKDDIQKAKNSPIIVSKDGLILDGHHRYIAMKEMGFPKMAAIVCWCPIKELIELGHQFDGSFTKTVYETTIYGKRIWEENDNTDSNEELMIRRPLRPY